MTAETITVADAPEGAVVETLIMGVPGGNVYKLGGIANHLTGHRYGYKRFTNERATLHPTLKVVPADDLVDAEGRWIK